ncbi:MAG: hypothetical protein WD431_16360 [Cyclobacteriaceae bacterium]
MDNLEEVDAQFKKIITPKILQTIVNSLPDEWLLAMGEEGPVDVLRKTYLDFLLLRLENSEIFVKEAQHARQTLV